MNDEFLDDIAQAKNDQDHLHVWWLGQSGFLVQWLGYHLLMDPYLSDSLTKKYANTDKPHIRMTERVIAPERLNFIDVVTSSHNHTDHLDGETITPLLNTNPGLVVMVSQANLEFSAQRLQVLPHRLTAITPQQPVQTGPFTFHAVPSAHEVLEADELGNPKYIGLVVKAGPWTLYHSGDTVRYAGMDEQLRQWQIDLAMLPINGRDPRRGVAGNLSGAEAAQLAFDSKVRLVIPCHYQMFQFNSATPEEFIQTAQQLSQAYHVLGCGQRFSL
jgi:L-ascorbate metabolism protein UlaG (beta-lactamase superfamily)